jgi:hypothetical protein
MTRNISSVRSEACRTCTQHSATCALTSPVTPHATSKKFARQSSTLRCRICGWAVGCSRCPGLATGLHIGRHGKWLCAAMHSPKGRCSICKSVRCIADIIVSHLMCEDCLHAQCTAASSLKIEVGQLWHCICPLLVHSLRLRQASHQVARESGRSQVAKGCRTHFSRLWASGRRHEAGCCPAAEGPTHTGLQPGCAMHGEGQTPVLHVQQCSHPATHWLRDTQDQTT